MTQAILPINYRKKLKNDNGTGRLPTIKDPPITKKREFSICLVAATSEVMHTRTVTLSGPVPREETRKQ